MGNRYRNGTRNMVDGKIRQALETMPKSELHLHIEGTLEPELALTLADRNGVTLPWRGIDDLRAQYEFENLQSFLDLYYALMKTLKTKDDFKDLMLAYLTRANADGVKHAEVFFDPQVHVCTNGLDFNMVLDGLLEGMMIGRERFGITGGLILSIVRDMDIDSANRILDMAAPRKPRSSASGSIRRKSATHRPNSSISSRGQGLLAGIAWRMPAKRGRRRIFAMHLICCMPSASTTVFMSKMTMSCSSVSCAMAFHSPAARCRTSGCRSCTICASIQFPVS